MEATIGRIVHYVSRTGKHLPAIVYEVLPLDALSLEIFGPFTPKLVQDVKCDPTGTDVATWHWPEREK